MRNGNQAEDRIHRIGQKGSQPNYEEWKLTFIDASTFQVSGSQPNYEEWKQIK